MPTFDVKTDGHVHTSLCHHAVGTMADYAQAACDQGLTGLIFLEHFETGINYFETTWLTPTDFEAYFVMGRALQEAYRGRLAIGLGVEVGYNPEAVAETIDFLGCHSWDRVGLSYHFLAHEGRHLNMLSRKGENLLDFTRIGVKRLVSAYLDGLLAALEQLPVTVLCHLDAALRHHPEIAFDRGHEEQMRAILAVLARKGIALEINTSGFDHPRRQPYPPVWLLTEAMALGIPLVVGSDAHRPQEVGRHFARLPQALA